MEKTVKRDWRNLTITEVCPNCIYFDDCWKEHDCKAIEILVKIHEDMDSGNPDY